VVGVFNCKVSYNLTVRVGESLLRLTRRKSRSISAASFLFLFMIGMCSQRDMDLNPKNAVVGTLVVIMITFRTSKDEISRASYVTFRRNIRAVTTNWDKF
jgi:hypothetical protein